MLTRNIFAQNQARNAFRNASNSLRARVGDWATHLALDGLFFRMRLENGVGPLGTPVDYAGNAIGPLSSVTALLKLTDQNANRLIRQAESLASFTDPRLQSDFWAIAPSLERSDDVMNNLRSSVIVPNHWGRFGDDVTNLWGYYLQVKTAWNLSCRVVDFASFMAFRCATTFNTNSLIMTLINARSQASPTLGVVLNDDRNIMVSTAYDSGTVDYKLPFIFPERQEKVDGIVPNFKFDADLNEIAEALAMIYVGLSPNLTGGLCSLTLHVYVGNTIMNDDGGLVNPRSRGRPFDVRGTIRFDIVLRISRHLDIAALNVVFLTMRVFAEIRARLQLEKYRDSFGQDPRDGLTIRYLRAVSHGPLNIVDATVRAGDLDTARSVGLLYKNAPCWGLQLSYGSFWNMLQAKNKTLFSPKSENNCFMLAFFYAQEQFHPANLSAETKRQIGSKARQAMVRYRREFAKNDVEGEMYSVRNMCEHFASSPRRPAFRVWSMRGVLLFEHLQNMPEYVEIAVAYGHAFAITAKPDLVGLNAMELKALRQKYPALPTPNRLASNQYGKPFRKKRSYENNYKMCVLDLETTVTGTLYATGFYEFSEEADLGNWTDAELDNCHIWSGPDSLMDFFDYALDRMARGPKYLIFAHFGGGFDFLYYVREALRHQAEGKSFSYFSKCLEVQGGIIKLRHTFKREQMRHVKKNYLNITLRDSFPLLRASLDRLSKAFKPMHPKKPELIHHELVTDDNWLETFEGDGELYLKHDLLSLAEILSIFRTKMINLFEIDPIPIVTLPSLSRTIFMQKYYQPTRYPLCNLHPDLDVSLRKAYFGGRVEAHQLGVVEGPIYYFDVTSEYPFVMMQDLPYGTPSHLPHGARDRIPYGLLRVKVLGGWEDRPNLFPVRGPNGLIYPFFESPFEMFVWSEEVQYSIDSRFPYDFEILEAWEFKKAPYYRDCVRDLYRIKRDAESPVERQIGKDTINSGYGIWGMKTLAVMKIILETATRFNPSPVSKYLETMTLKQSNVMENAHFMRVESNLEGCSTFIPLAVAVTAKARIHLFRLMDDIINAGGRVLYTDTDSVITDIDIGDPKYGIDFWREEENEMGQVKVEFDDGPISRPEVTILGSKFYGFPPSSYSIEEEHDYKAKLTLKGFYKKYRWGFMTRNVEKKKIHFRVPSQIAERAPFFLTYEHFKDMANGWILKHDVIRLVTKTRGWINNQCNVGREEMTIGFTMNYKKGKVEEDLSVVPWKWDGVKFH